VQEAEVGITIDSVSNTAPRWGIDEVNISGTTANAASDGTQGGPIMAMPLSSSDSVTIDWGDGTITDNIAIVNDIWGPVSHTYDGAHVGTNNIVAKLVRNSNIIDTSDPSQVNVQKHDTTLTLTINPTTVGKGGPYVVSGVLKDKDTGAVLASKTIKFITESPIVIGDTITNAFGKYSAALRAPLVAGEYDIRAQFAGDGLYEAKNSIIGVLTVT
jgi:hypothetical protein